MSQTPNAYYEHLQGRLRSLLIRVEDQLPRPTTALISEFIDANECGLALEKLSDILYESEATIDPDIVLDVRALAAIMELDSRVADRLDRPGE